jgi:hypothetical protein
MSAHHAKGAGSTRLVGIVLAPLHCKRATMGLPVRVVRTRKRHAPYLGTLPGGLTAVKKHRTGRGRVLGVKQKIDGRKGDRSVSLR